MNYPEWNGTPNCRSADPEAFFTADGSGTYTEVIALKRVCGSCEVQKQCLDYALKHEVSGFWGGTTESQRRKTREQLGIKSIPLYLSYS